MAEKVVSLTLEGKAKLEAELINLKTVKREEIAEKIMEYSKELMDVANAAKQRETVPAVATDDADTESLYLTEPSQLSLSDDVTILDIDPDSEDFE